MTQLERRQDKRITISSRAVKEIKQIIKSNNIPDEYALRIKLKTRSCGGFSYILLFDIVKESDVVFFSEGIKIVVDSKSLSHLEGAEIDFVEHRFVFHNPNVVSSCGCDDSFST